MTRVAVTGLGLVLPQGVGIGAADAVFEGRSAVGWLSGLPGLEGATGAALPGFRPPAGTERLDRAIQFAVAAAEGAWEQAGFASAPPDSGRVAAIISLSKGGMFSLGQMRGRRSSDDGLWLHASPDAGARVVSARLGLRGPMGSPITACASGGHALVWGARLIQQGAADVAIVGAAEASLHPLVIGSYRRMGVLADARGNPAASVRPFSATRRGFALGEGAGVLVLEALSSAAQRGAKVFAIVAGWALGTQAGGLTGMEPGGESLAHLASAALARAGVEPRALDYVNAHGTATPENDLAEARAIHSALGRAADQVSVSSTKGSHGHLLGAAAAVELVLAVLAMGRGEVPPTCNLTDADPAVRLDCTPLAPRPRTIRHALKLASGFGGQALAICLAAP